MAMPRLTGADQLAREDMEGGEQSRRAMPLVVMGHRGPRLFFKGSPGWVRSRAWIWLFSSAQKTRALSGGLRVEPDHVRQLLDELGIAADLERAGLMRLEPMRVPDPMDGFRADADHGGQGTGRPVRGRWRQEGRGEGYDPLDGGRRDARWATSARSVLFNASQPLLDEPAAPAPDAFAISLQRDGNVFVQEALGSVEHDLGTQHQASGGSTPSSSAGQGLTFRVGELKGDGNSQSTPPCREALPQRNS